LTILVIGLISIICLGSLVGEPLTNNFSSFNRLIGYSLSSWASACIVVWLIVFRGSRYTRLLRSAQIRYLATISYGIYLLHPLVWHFVSDSGRFGLHIPQWSLSCCIATISLTILAASFSWYAFERPIARLRERLFPSRLPAPAVVMATAASDWLVSSPSGAVAPQEVR
jgi:peptidoglycan/LPS O-acetylase OafA/YrhL